MERSAPPQTSLAVPNLSRRVAPSPSRRRIPSASILPLHRRRVPSASSPPPTQPRSGPLRLHPLPRFAARLSPRERWTADEHDRFLHALVLFGRVWKRIEAFVVLVTSTQPRPEALPKVSELGLPTPAPHPRRAAVVTDAVTPSDETLIRDVFSHREALGHHDARPPPQRPRPPRCRPPGKNHIKMAPGQNRGRSKPPTADVPVTEYEKERAQRMMRNNQVLQSLGVTQLASFLNSCSNGKSKRVACEDSDSLYERADDDEANEHGVVDKVVLSTSLCCQVLLFSYEISDYDLGHAQLLIFFGPASIALGLGIDSLLAI
ncbi:hypothetical protein HU200_046468 [Digitaria exilis]|uniref:Uncharacterized protein n=1 Tax=Digitaria exilis TaxID=1010633 RepID=A0A835AVE2_9POAL|nr:hypothetical protein HU200_046468 [Digitaria exilis]